MEIIPTCPFCGVPILEDASVCDECRLETRKHMVMLREYLVRTLHDKECELPYKYRKLS